MPVSRGADSVVLLYAERREAKMHGFPVHMIPSAWPPGIVPPAPPAGRSRGLGDDDGVGA